MDTKRKNKRPYRMLFRALLLPVLGYAALAPKPALAFLDVVGDVIGGFVGAILSIIAVVMTIITAIVAELFEFVMTLFIGLAKYNEFLDAPVVEIGWVFVRDLANMFFIFILVLIAVSTMLGYRKMHYKEHLGQLLMMAVLINFSKMFTGILIDFSQVIMLTFAFATEKYAAAFSIVGTGLARLGQLGQGFADSFSSSSDWTSAMEAPFTLIISNVMEIALMLFATSIIGAMCLMILARMVYLWLLVILSPMAFLLSTFDQGQEYYKKWWSMLKSNLVLGPSLMFFVWLAFSMQTRLSEFHTGTSIGDLPSVGVSAMGTGDALIGFAITMALLLGGIKLTTEAMGSAGGASFVRKGASVLPSYLAQRVHAGRALPFAGKGNWFTSGINSINQAFKGLQMNPYKVGDKWKQGFKDQAHHDQEEGDRGANDGLSTGGLWGLVKGSTGATDRLMKDFGTKGYLKGIRDTVMRPRSMRAAQAALDQETAALAGEEALLNERTAHDRGLALATTAADADIMTDHGITIPQMEGALRNVDDGAGGTRPPTSREIEVARFAAQQGMTLAAADQTLQNAVTAGIETVIDQESRGGQLRMDAAAREAFLGDEATILRLGGNEITGEITRLDDETTRMVAGGVSDDHYRTYTAEIGTLNAAYQEAQRDIAAKETNGATDEQLAPDRARRDALVDRAEAIGGTFSIDTATGQRSIDAQSINDLELEDITDAETRTRAAASGARSTQENATRRTRLETLANDQSQTARAAVEASARARRGRINTIAAQLSSLRDPYEAQFNATHRREWIKEEDKKLDTYEPSGLLASYTSMAQAGKGKSAAAAALRMAQSGNLRELLSDTVGRVDAEGLRQFATMLQQTNNAANPLGAGLSEQDALMVIGDMSQYAEKLGQFKFARVVESEQGRYTLRDSGEQRGLFQALQERRGIANMYEGDATGIATINRSSLGDPDTETIVHDEGLLLALSASPASVEDRIRRGRVSDEFFAVIRQMTDAQRQQISDLDARYAENMDQLVNAMGNRRTQGTPRGRADQIADQMRQIR